MKAAIVTYIRHNNTKVQVLVLQDAETQANAVLLADQVSATDEEFLCVVGIERLTESTVIHLCGGEK